MEAASRRQAPEKAVIIFLLALAAACLPAEATHFRGASTSYELSNSRILTVTVYAAWRNTFIDGVTVELFSDADTNRNVVLRNLAQISVEVVQSNVPEYPGAPVADGYFTVRKHVFRTDMTGFPAGWYAARFESGNRVNGCVNVGMTRFSVECRVDYRTPGTANWSPVMVPATIDMIARGLPWSQNLFASDPDGGSLSFAFRTGINNPVYGPAWNIPGLSVDSNGQLSMSAASTAALLNERRYVYKVRVTDSAGSYAERDVLVVSRDAEPGDGPPVLAPIGDKYVFAGGNVIFTASATDPTASDNLTLRITTTPPGVIFPTVISKTPVSSTFTWLATTPPGIYTAGIEVADGVPAEKTVLIDNEIFRVFVIGNNSFPTLDPIGNKYVPVPGTLTFTVTGSDPETPNASLSFTASFLPPGATFDPATRVFSWTPTGTQRGVWTGIVFRVTDNDAVTPLFDEEIISISVDDNRFPNFDAVPNQTVEINTGLSLLFSSTDPDGDVVDFSLLSQPGGSVFQTTPGAAAAASLRWIPSTTGTFGFNVSAFDNGTPVLSQARNFTVTVIRNTTPLVPASLSPISAALSSDTTPLLSFVLADPDGDSVKYRIQLSSDPAFAALDADYESVFLSTGASGFTVGQAAGGGIYRAGSAGSFLAGGNYYWRAKAVDIWLFDSGYSTAASSSTAFIINSTPSITLNSPVDGAIQSGNSPVFSLSISDPESHQVRYNIEVSSDSGFAAFDFRGGSALAAPGAFTTSPGSFRAGQYYWRAGATDQWGAFSSNVSANSGAVAFIIDSTPNAPSSPAVSPLAHTTVTHTAAPTLSMAVSDPDGGSLRYRIEIISGGSTVVDYSSALAAAGNVSFTVGQAAAGGTYTTGFAGQNLAHGVYSWRVRAVDPYGLSSAATDGTGFTVNQPPTVASLSPASASFCISTSTPPSFSFTASDPDSDTVSYVLKLYPINSSTPDATLTSVLGSAGVLTTSTGVLSAGSYWWDVYATDSHGSTSTVAVSTGPGFVVNDRPGTPTLAVNLPYSSNIIRPGVDSAMCTLSLISDPESDNLAMRFQVSSSNNFSSIVVDYQKAAVNWATYFFSGSSFIVGQAAGTGSYSVGGPAQVLTSGLYYVRARSSDSYNSGDWSTPEDVRFRVDSSPLQASGLSPSNDATINSTTPVLSFSLDDPENDRMRYLLEIQSTTGQTVLKYYSDWMTEGAKTFQVGTSSNVINGGSFSSSSNAFYSTNAHSLPKLFSGNGYNWRITAYDEWDVDGTVPSRIWASTTVSYAFNTNSEPYAPTDLSPSIGATTSASKPTLSFRLLDPNPADALTYQIDITSSASGFSTPDYSYISGSVTQGVHSHIPASSLAKGSYYWRVTSTDPSAAVAVTTAAGGGVAFIVNQLPSDPTPLSPFSNESYAVGYSTPVLSFTLADTDGDSVGFRVQISPRADFASLEIDYRSPVPAAGGSYTIGQSASGNQYLIGQPGQNLAPSGNYYWRVQALDAKGDANSGNAAVHGNSLGFITASTPASSPHFRTSLLPAATLISPTVGASTSPGGPLFSFSLDDPENDQLRYEIKVSTFPSYAEAAVFTTTSPAAEGAFTASGGNLAMNHRGDFAWSVQGIDGSGRFAGAAGIAYSTASNRYAFIINSSPSTPSSLSISPSVIVGSTTFCGNSSPSFGFTLSDSDPDPLRYRMIIDNSSDFGSPLIDYTSPSYYDPYAEDTHKTGLIHHWKLDDIGSTTTPDAVTTGGANLLIGGTMAATGVHGRALSFDGSDDELTSSTNGLVNNLSEFSLSAWVYPVATSSANMALLAQEGVFELYTDSDGASPMIIRLWTSSGGNVGAVQSIQNNRWTHVMVTGTGSDLKLYLDGVQKAFDSGAAVVTANYGSSDKPLRVGSNFADPARRVRFKGLMDDIRIYNSTIPPGQIDKFLSRLPTSHTGTAVHAVGSTGSVADFASGVPSTTLPGGMYYYIIRSSDVFGNSSADLSGSFVINTTPSAPQNLSPSIGQTTTSGNPLLTFTGSDSDGDQVYYTLTLAANGDFVSPSTVYRSVLGSSTSFVFQVGQAAAGGVYTTGSQGQSLAHGGYNWKAFLTDQWGFTGSETLAASSGNAFAVNQAPGVPVISTPYGSTVVRSSAPSFVFSTTDPDGDYLRYTLSVDDDAGFSSPIIVYRSAYLASGSAAYAYGQAAGGGSYLTGASGVVLSAGTYYWKISAADAFGDSSTEVQASTSGSGYAFRYNAAPAAATALSPASGGAIVTRTPALSFSVSDPESDRVGAVIEISSSPSFSALDASGLIPLSSPGSFSYTPAQPLREGSYYWRVRSFDESDPAYMVSSTANSGATAFTLDTSPVYGGVCEISPGSVTQSSRKTLLINLATTQSSTSTGFNEIVIFVPAAFGVPAAPVSALLVAGSPAGHAVSVSGQTVTITLASVVSASALATIALDLDTPPSSRLDGFSVSVRHTTYGELQTVGEGDGDQQGNGGSLKVQTQSAGAALLTITEIKPNQAVQAAETEFTLHLDASFDQTTSGIDLIVFDLPSGYQLLRVGQLLKNGVSIAYSSPATAGNHVELRLPANVRDNSLFQAKFTARCPLAPSTDSFAGATVRTESPAVSTAVTEGDGDRGGDGGSLSVVTSSAGVALSAKAEVLPVTVLKGTSGVALTLHVRAVADPSTSGANRISFQVPAELASATLTRVSFAGSSIPFTYTNSSGLVTAELGAALNMTGVFGFDITADSADSMGASAISGVTLLNTVYSSSLAATEGDGDGNGVDGTLLVVRVPVGAVTTASGVVSPSILFKNDTTETTLRVDVTKGSADSGFNRVHFRLPQFILSASVSRVKWNGASILYSSDTRTSGGSIELFVAPASLIAASGYLSVTMRLGTANTEESDPIAEPYIAYTTGASVIYDTTSSYESPIQEGAAPGLSLETRSAGPAADTYAEIQPAFFTKGKRAQFHYFLYPAIEPRNSGVNYLEFTAPSTLSNARLLGMQVNGTSVVLSGSDPGGSPIRMMFPLITASSVIDLSLEADFTTEAGIFPMSAAVLDYSTAASLAAYSARAVVTASTGDGDHRLDGGTLFFQTQPAGPALDLVSEVSPNQAIKGSGRDFTYYFNLNFDGSSSGVDTLTLILPDTFQPSSIRTVQINGSSVGFTDRSGVDAAGRKHLKAGLAGRLVSDCVASMVVFANLPVNPMEERLGFAFVDDSAYTFPRMTREGDGDGKGDGGSLLVKTKAKATVVSAVSELRPFSATKSALVEFTYDTALSMDTQTSGIDGFSLQLPATFTEISLLGVRRDGSSVAFTDRSSAAALDAALASPITESSVLSLRFRARMPGNEDTEVLPGMVLRNESAGLSDQSLAGDGDQKGDGGTLTLRIAAAGPAAQAVAEIRPGQAIKGTTGLDFSYHIDCTLDSSSSQVKSLSLALPPGYSNPRPLAVRVNGAAVLYTSGVGANSFTATLTDPLTASGLITLEFRADCPATLGTEAFQPAVLQDLIGRTLPAVEGRTSGTASGSHSLSVTLRSSGAGREAYGEIVPSRAVTGKRARLALHTRVLQDSTSSPVRRITLDVPHTLKSPSFVTAQVDGSSVNATAAISGQSLDVRLENEVAASAVISLIFEATPLIAVTERFSSARTWYRWGMSAPADDVSTAVAEGDGDLGRYSDDDTLNLTVSATAPAGRAQAEISPLQAPAESELPFAYSVQISAGGQTEGIDRLTLDLPYGYSGRSVQAVLWNGVSVATASTVTSGRLALSLDSAATGDGVLKVLFRALSPVLQGRERFSLCRIGNSATGQWMAVEEGDGDGLGPQGSNSLWVETLPRPPASSALAELSPNEATLAEEGTFHLQVLLDFLGNASGVEALRFRLPASFRPGAIERMKLSGQSIAFSWHLDSASRIFYATPASAIDRATVLDLEFTATPLLGYGSDLFEAPLLIGRESSIRALEGDADASSSTPENSLRVSQHPPGPVKRVVAEITPNRAVEGLPGRIFTCHAYVNINAAPVYAGFDTVEMDVPSTFASPRLLSLRVDGSSVAYGDQSVSRRLKAVLLSPLEAGSVLPNFHVVSMSFSATPPSFDIQESFSQLRFSHRSRPGLFTWAREGDGDNGRFGAPANSWKVRTQASLPASVLEAEMTPERLRGGSLNQVLDLFVYARVEEGNSGIRTLEVRRPASLSVKSRTLYVNDTVVGRDESSADLIRYTFSPPISFESVIRLSMVADVQSGDIPDSFAGVRVLDESGVALQAAEGDGDRGRYASSRNSLSFRVSPVNLLTHAETRITPHTFETGSLTVFSLITLVVLREGDAGVDTVLLGIPSLLSGAQFEGVYLQPDPGANPDLSTPLASSWRVTSGSVYLNGLSLGGLSKSSSVPPGSTGFRIVLSRPITRTSLLEIRLRANASLAYEEAAEFSNFALHNSAYPSVFQTVETAAGRDWQITAVNPRDVLEAVAEISPGQVLVRRSGETRSENFSYFLRTTPSRLTGFDRMRFRFPVTYGAFSFRGLYRYQSVSASPTAIAASASISGSEMTVSLVQAVNTPALLELRFSAMPPETPGFEYFSLVDLYNDSFRDRVQVFEGDTGLRPAASTHSLRVDTLRTQTMTSMLAEADPGSVVTPRQGFGFTYQVRMGFDINSAGVDYLQLILPPDFVNCRLGGITVNRSAVLYEDRSYYALAGFSPDPGGIAGGTVAVKLAELLRSNSDVVLFLRADLRPSEKTVRISQFTASRFPLSENTAFPASEGDGGDGTGNSWSLRLLAPASGFRSLSDYPLVLFSSGDFATPVLAGYGVAGERVSVFDGTTLAASGVVDAGGFYALRTGLLSQGWHALTLRLHNVAGQATYSSPVRLHYVGESSGLAAGDMDRDGIADIDDPDQDGDGIADLYDPFPADTDNDGRMNSEDADDDNDGIFDERELANGTNPLVADTNGDGISDRDSASDSDNDGLCDSADPRPDEAASLTDSDGDGVPDSLDADDDNDGISDKYDLMPYDTDNDGLNNFIDPDDDNDGVSDERERTVGTNPLVADTNGDGVPDLGLLLDSDGDGLSDDLDPAPISAALNDLDSDGIPDREDPDADGDGVNNADDRFIYDFDNDGINDHVDPDDDNDGIPDAQDMAPASLGSASLAYDTDNDGLPNHLDPDDDNDALPDADEPGFSLDGNNDGNTDRLGAKVYYGDRDGVTDSLERNVGTDARSADTNGDGLMDTGFVSAAGDRDGDAIPDDIDAAPTDPVFDSDRDGTPDRPSDYLLSLAGGGAFAMANNARDADSDGIANFFDSRPFDTDNDASGNSADADDDGDGIPDASDKDPMDSDNDGIVNKAEKDADNDGLPDNLERILGTNPYNSREDRILRPDDPALDLAGRPFRAKAANRSFDWSRITGDGRDKALPISYESRDLSLPVIPLWEVVAVNDREGMPAGCTDLLWGQMNMRLNHLFAGKTLTISVPLTDRLVENNRRLEFHVMSRNARGQWVEIPASVTQNGRTAAFTVGPHSAIRIWYRDFGWTRTPAENNASGGCVLRKP